MSTQWSLARALGEFDVRDQSYQPRSDLPFAAHVRAARLRRKVATTGRFVNLADSAASLALFHAYRP